MNEVPLNKNPEPQNPLQMRGPVCSEIQTRESINSRVESTHGDYRSNLAHKKPPLPTTLPWACAYGPKEVLGRGTVSCERGIPATSENRHRSRLDQGCSSGQGDMFDHSTNVPVHERPPGDEASGIFPSKLVGARRETSGETDSKSAQHIDHPPTLSV